MVHPIYHLVCRIVTQGMSPFLDLHVEIVTSAGRPRWAGLPWLMGNQFTSSLNKCMNM